MDLFRTKQKKSNLTKNISDLKFRLDDLDSDLVSLREENIKLKERIIKLEKPPHYKVGSKIEEDWMVSETPTLYYKKEQINTNFLSAAQSLQYQQLNRRTEIPCGYSYRLINIKTGEKKIIEKQF